MTPDIQSERLLIQQSADQRAALTPVNNTSLTHRGRDRGTDTQALQRMWVKGSPAWVTAHMERMGVEK